MLSSDEISIAKGHPAVSFSGIGALFGKKDHSICEMGSDIARKWFDDFALASHSFTRELLLVQMIQTPMQSL